MSKTILITGATDGIGFEAAKQLAKLGHHLLIHGRNSDKLSSVKHRLIEVNPSAVIETCLCDLSDLLQVKQWIQRLVSSTTTLDIVINNAGVFKVQPSKTEAGLDVRFVVNTLAPYLLTKSLQPVIKKDGRVINLSSAAQAPVSIEALRGNKTLNDSEAYAQSKLALTMWSHWMGEQHRQEGPMIVSVNPASFLGSKMVQEAYGIAGNSLQIGADILVKAALSDSFTNAAGCYFDNDAGTFANPHPDAMNQEKCLLLINEMDALINRMTNSSE